LADDYEIWAVENKPVSVHLRAFVAGQIRALANVAPDGRSEIECGGVLWGRVRSGSDNYYIVSIERADSLACDHSRGEAWVLSDRDRRSLRKRLKEKHGDLQPVGYWRSHRRLGLYLDNRDFDLMSGAFAQPWCVALCVRPPATAGFFFWEDADIRRTSSYREFQLPDAGQPAIVPPPAPVYPWSVVADHWQRWAIAASVAVVLMAAPFLLKSRNAGGTPFNMLSMKADVAAQGVTPGTVRLHWDTHSQVLRQTTTNGAIMWIADGPDESKLELTPEQVRLGSLDYKANSPDVNFRMQVGQFSESLRVTGVASPPVVARTQEAIHETIQAPVQEPVRPAVVLPVASNAPTPASVEPRAAPEPTAVRSSGVQSSGKKTRGKRTVVARTLEPPRPVARETAERSRELDVPAPPQLAFAPATLDKAPVPNSPVDVPKVVTSVEKPNASPLKRAFGWMIPNRRKDFVPAKAVKQVQPLTRVQQSTSVAVRVSIDQQGVVQEADVLTKDIDSGLANSVVEAAKRWRFEPARVDDRPVASNLVVRFRFGNDR